MVLNATYLLVILPKMKKDKREGIQQNPGGKKGKGMTTFTIFESFYSTCSKFLLSFSLHQPKQQKTNSILFSVTDIFPVDILFWNKLGPDPYASSKIYFPMTNADMVYYQLSTSSSPWRLSAHNPTDCKLWIKRSCTQVGQSCMIRGLHS